MRQGESTIIVKGDFENYLKALTSTVLQMAKMVPPTPENRGYIAGELAMISLIAEAFGLFVPTPQIGPSGWQEQLEKRLLPNVHAPVTLAQKKHGR
jgi:hypothetical protein